MTESGKCDCIKGKTNRLHTWMYTLLYPAVLGSMIVTYAIALTEHDQLFISTISGYAIFLIVYFSSQHVENTVDNVNYNLPSFFADILEIAMMFVLFVLLGMYKTEWEITESGPWTYLYGALFVALLAPVGGRYFENYKNYKTIENRLARNIKRIFPCKFYGWLSFLSILAALSVAFGNIIFARLTYKVTDARSLRQEDYILITISVIVALYLIFFVFRREKTEIRLPKE